MFDGEKFLDCLNDIDDNFLLEGVPLDLKAICDPVEHNNLGERSQCTKNLITELQKHGHALVCGTSVSRFICRDALYASHLLLCEVDESIRGSCRSQNECLRGYAPKCTERSNSSGLTDMVRKFRLGSKKGAIQNIWPVGRSLDEETDEYIRSSLEEYHGSLHRVAGSITKSILETLSSDTKIFQTNETILQHTKIENTSTQSHVNLYRRQIFQIHHHHHYYHYHYKNYHYLSR